MGLSERIKARLTCINFKINLGLVWPPKYWGNIN